MAGKTILLANGPLWVTNRATIDASTLPGGAIVDAAGKSRVFEITNGASVTLRSLTVTNGFETNGIGGGGAMVEVGATLIASNCTFCGNTAAGYLGLGGAVCVNGTATLDFCTIIGNSGSSGAGLFNDYGQLTLSNCVVTGNSSLSDNGGGIQTSGTTTLYDSVISSNSCYNAGGGIYADDGMVTLNNSRLLGNSGYGGGGILNQATFRLTNCTVSGNNCTFANGGAIINSGLISLDSCTLSSNFSAYASGGAIYNSGTNTLNNCTLSGNTSGYSGGGICNFNGAMTLNACTICGNAGYDAGGIYNASASAVRLTNTIVAANTVSNLFGAFMGVGNFTNGNPGVQVLGNYGGLTATMPPLAGSPCIDAGVDSITSFLPTDQRGYSRLSGAHVDIGAVEVRIAPAANQFMIRNASWISLSGSYMFQFDFTNAPGKDFTALSSTNLGLPLSNWTVLNNAVETSSGHYQFIDPKANTSPRAFYRIVSP
jgi:predicted outer membrane repeat protein